MENSRQNVERQCFYQGQSVAPEHLNKLQDFTMQGQSNLVASLLGYGIVNGFKIEKIEGHIIGVSAGLAFNVQGERLVLAEGKQVNLIAHKPNTGDKTIKIGVMLNYEKTEPATDSMGNTVYTKWVPTVQFITGETLEGLVFELATIKINPVSIVEIKTTAPNFGTLPKIEETLLQQIQALSNKTSALTTGDESTSITAPFLNLILGSTTNAEGNVTSKYENLLINGVPYMEIGSNDNGHYVKFENGLLIVWGQTEIYKYPYVGENIEREFVYPYAFITPPITISLYLLVNIKGAVEMFATSYYDNMHTQHKTNTSMIGRIFSVTNPDSRGWGMGYVNIGFWK